MIAIEKAYQLRAIGGKEVYDQLDKIHKKFTDIRDVKKSLNDQMARVKDTDEYKALAEQLKNVQKEYRTLQRELKTVKLQMEEFKMSQKQADADAKRSAQATVANAKAATEAAKAATEAQKQATQQSTQALLAEKQAAAQAHAQLKQLQLQRAQTRAAAPAAAPGSYNDIAAQYKAALSNYKATVSLQDAAALEMAQKHLMTLKTQLDSFNRSLTEDKVLIGEYTSGVMNAFKKMGLGHLIQDQVKTAKASLDTLNVEFNQLKHQLEQIRATGVGSLDAVERQLIENRNAALQLQSQLDHVHTELKAMGGIGSQVTQALNNEFKNLKQSVAQFIIGYAGFQTIITGIRSAVHINYELSDSFADIKNRIRGTDDEVNKLFNDLKNLDTRSSLASLVDIASIVSKKGIAKEEIVGITKAIDDLMVSLGGEIGDPKEAVASLVKLVNVYSHDKHVTAENIEAIGGAIARLTNSGVATGQFLLDFADRMGGVARTSNLSIQGVLGFGAAMQELGQSAEVAATATSQVIVKMFTDSEKYATLLNMSVSQFKDTLSRDVMGVMLMVSEKMKGDVEGLSKFFEEMVDVHMRGQRTIGVMGDVASSVEYITARLKVSREAFKEQGIAADMAANKQQTFAASIDRMKKAFEMVATDKTVVGAMDAFAKAVATVLGQLPLLITLLKGVVIGYVALNAAQIARNIATVAEIGLSKAQAMWTSIVDLKNKAYTLTMGVMTRSINLATAAKNMFNTALAASPLGVVLVGLTALSTVYGLLSAAIGGTTEELKKQTKEDLMRLDVLKRANDHTEAQITKIKTLTTVAKDLNLSQDVRLSALEEIIRISPEYLSALTLETIATKEGKKAIDDYVASLNKKARAEAAGSALSDLLKKDAHLKMMELSLAKKVAAGKDGYDNLSDNEKEMLGVYGNTMSTMTGITPGMNTFGTEALSNVRIARKKLQQEIAIAQKLSDEATISSLQLSDKEKELKSRNEAKQKIEMLKSVRDMTEETSKEYQELTKRMEAARAEWYKAGGQKPTTLHDAFVNLSGIVDDATDKGQNSVMVNGKRMSLLTAKTKLKELASYIDESEKIHSYFAKKDGPGHGTALTRFETEEFKKVNSWRDEELVKLKTAYMEQEETRKVYNGRMIDNERTYLEQMQLLEEQAIQMKIDSIKGSTPAELQKRSGLRLDILENRSKYSSKFFDMDSDRLKEDYEGKLATAKRAMQNVVDSQTATDLQKSEAKRDFYEKQIDLYDDYMRNLDDVERRYHKKVRRNAGDREQIQSDIDGSYEDIKRKIVDQYYAENTAKYDAQGRKVMLGKIKQTSDIITSGSGIGSKQVEMERLSMETNMNLLNIEQERINKEIELTKGLYEQKFIAAEEYNQRLNALVTQQAQNQEQILTAQVAKEQQSINVRKEIINGGIQVAETIGMEAMAAQARRAQIEDARNERAMSWNRRKLEAHAQSRQEMEAIDKAMAMQQEQRERQRAEQEKRRRLNEMAMEYASAAMKIVAANIWMPHGVAKIAVQEGILAATYAAKLAFAHSVPAFEQGGILGSGGVFGGKSHANGGSKFMWGGSVMEAERDELAIINKRSAASNRPMTVTGTPRQIASRVNAVGGGVDFAPGATSWNGRGVGWMAEYSQVPSFIAGHYMRKGGMYGGSSSDGSNAEVLQSIIALKDHVHNIQVQLNPHEVAGYNAEYRKSVNVGTI